MSKARKLLIALLVAVVVAVAAVAAYVIVQNNTAPEELSASVPSASGTFDAANLDGTWTVGSGSVAGYRVDEVLGGQDVTVVGRTEQVSGSVTVKDSTLTAAQVTVNVDSVQTDNGNRDSEFRKLLKTAEHPDAVFELTEPLTLAPSAQGAATYEAVGTLTVSGVTQNVTAAITATNSADVTQIVGNIPVVFEDYGIKAPDMGFVTVEDEGVVEFSVNLTK